MRAGDDEQLLEILTGTVSVSEVTNDELTAAKMPSAKCTCEQAEWKAFFEPVAKAFWPALKEGLGAYSEQAKAKWRN